MFTQLQGLAYSVGILDVIDIAIVSYCLYRLYLMMKNTRAATLVKGLLILGMFSFVSRASNLHVISWLLDKGMTIIMVALPVVFQPELRRALEHIGRGKLFHKTSQLNEQEFDAMLDEVATAATVMARHKVGALIVFERATGLEDRIDTGVALDALVSNGLLQNIFVKDTPLHDGAVIIRGRRIVAASCLLPLSENRNLSQELGTRHRAAVGISEQSDALVLVVSEETGTISITRNGDIYQHMTADDVKNMIKEAFFKDRKAEDNTLLGRYRSWKANRK